MILSQVKCNPKGYACQCFFAEGSQGWRWPFQFQPFFEKTLLSGFDSTTFAGILAVSILTALDFISSFFKLIKLVFVFRKNYARPARTSPRTDHWFGFLSGETLENQQLCPFLFQYFGEPRFFCAIHNIKPVACRVFDREDCRQRLEGRSFHGNAGF